jgi:DNA-binding beta-propeller fold protein YncE
MRGFSWWQPVSSLTLVLALTGCDEKIVFDGEDAWPDLAMPAIGNGKLVITNSGSDSLSFVDLDTLEPVFELPVGLLPPEREGPHHLAVSPDNQFLYVGIANFVAGAGSGPHGQHGLGLDPGLLLKYEVATGRLVDQARVRRSPGDVRLTPDGKKILQTHFDLRLVDEVLEAMGSPDEMKASLAIIDTETMVPRFVDVCIAPHGVQVSADSKTAYIACNSSDELAIVDLESEAVELVKVGSQASSPQSPIYQPYAVTIQPVTGKVWVSNTATRELVVYDPATGALDATCGPIDLGGAPIFPTFSNDGALLFVPVQTSGTFSVVDTTTCTVITALPLVPQACLNPHAVLLSPDEKKAFVVCEGNHFEPGSLAVINLGNPSTPAVEKSIPLGVYPDDVVLVKP